MRVKTIIISLLLSSAAVVVVILSPLYKKSKPAPEFKHITPAELNVNRATVSYECSHHGKEWHICVQPEGVGAWLYCPAYSEFNMSDLALIESFAIGVPTPFEPCFMCPDEGSDCSTLVREVMTAAGIAEDQNATLWWGAAWGNLWEGALNFCEQLCETSKEGQPCSKDGEQCRPGELFCDYDPNDLEFTDDASTMFIGNFTNGTCRKCPIDPNLCYDEGFIATREGRQNCKNCVLSCTVVRSSKLSVDGEVIASQPIDHAIQKSHQNASGSLHDCSDLIFDSKSICLGAEGKICLVHFDTNSSDYDWQVSKQANKSGCVGVVAFQDGFDEACDVEIGSCSSNSNSELLIPYVFIKEEKGSNLLINKIGSNATVEVDVFGAYCSYTGEEFCTAIVSCEEGTFCLFYYGPMGQDMFNEGECYSCPKYANGDLNPLGCYFDDQLDLWDGDAWTNWDTVQNVQSCASSCGVEAVLTSNDCKFCPDDLTKFEFGIESEEDKCMFCPQNDLQFPDRIIPLFGANITCHQMESFFQRLPVSNNSSICQLAQSMNYICGCGGIGYAGASTQTKQAVLAWMPRIAAILSMMVSLS
jgi:hypothetical protein